MHFYNRTEKPRNWVDWTANNHRNKEELVSEGHIFMDSEKPRNLVE